MKGSDRGIDRVDTQLLICAGVRAQNHDGAGKAQNMRGLRGRRRPLLIGRSNRLE